MAPSARLSSGCGTTSSGSNCNSVPSPSHVGQAPAGALNENRRGSISSMVKPETGQAKREEKMTRSCVSFLLRSTPPFSPSPLRGEGWGGGGASPSKSGTPPSLTLPRKGGGDVDLPLASGLSASSATATPSESPS